MSLLTGRGRPWPRDSVVQCEGHWLQSETRVSTSGLFFTKMRGCGAFLNILTLKRNLKKYKGGVGWVEVEEHIRRDKW